MFTSLKNECRHIIATVVSYIFSGREPLIQAAFIFSTKLILRTVPTNTELFFAWFMQTLVTLVKLPAYGYNLNPIEMVFGLVKANVRFTPGILILCWQL